MPAFSMNDEDAPRVFWGLVFILDVCVEAAFLLLHWAC